VTSRKPSFAAVATWLSATALVIDSCAPDRGVWTDAIPGVNVAGRVTTAAGQPVPGARVLALGLAGPTCGYFLMGRDTTTDTLGCYALELRELTRSEVQGCVEIRVTPSSGLALASDTVRVTDVWFRDPPSPDTQRVDVLLPAGAHRAHEASRAGIAESAGRMHGIGSHPEHDL
jgi:hypothetical protein